MTCLSENTVAEFLQGDPTAAERVEEHIDQCPQCRAWVSNVGMLTKRGVEVPDIIVDEPTSPDAPSGAPATGTVLGGRFHILDALGKGSMGSVYRAEDVVLGTDVAIKLLHPEVACVPSLLRQLHRETLTSRRINHPNVRRVFDLGEADGIAFITMEFIEGETLASHLARGRPNPTDALAIIDQICAALDAAHNESVVHRDLKLSNIMIDRDAHVTVTDFGLARDLSRDTTTGGVAVGTPSYWSPEQSRGEPATPRSDIYALGIIMCDLFCGESRGTQSASLICRVPPALRHIVRKCLEPSPVDRYGSAADVRLAISRAGPRERGRRVAWIVAAGTAALAMVAITYAITRDADSPLPQATPKPSHSSGAAARDESPPPTGVAAPSEDHLTATGPALVRSARPDRSAKATKRRARHRRPKSEPGGSDTARPIEIAPGAVDELALAGERLDAVERERIGRGILLADLDGYSAARDEVNTAMSQNDAAAAEKPLEQLERLLTTAVVDERFIDRKLTRIATLSRARQRRGQHEKRLADSLAGVHEAYFAENFELANERLNQLWRLIEAGE